MILDSVSKYLIVDLDAAKTTADMPYVIDYVDMTTTTLVCASVDGVTNGVTVTTILPAPAASTQRKVNRISITNVDTASKGVSVGLVNVATARPLVGATLQVNDTLQYTDTRGWSVIDANGNTKTSAITFSSTLPSMDGAAAIGTGQTAARADHVHPSDTSREVAANKGAANGYAPLDAASKVPLANLPAAVAGALSYQGTWNAATNTPALASGVGTKGYYYKISVAGATNLDGHAVWSVDDAAIFDGATWDILQGGVTSGEVTAALGFTPENAANKDTSGGYVGLTLMAINFWNSAKTFMSRFTNANTAARTYTFQDRDGTIADHTDTLAAFATGGAIAPASINGVTVDATTNKPVTAASLNSGTLPVSGTTGTFSNLVSIGTGGEDPMVYVSLTSGNTTDQGSWAPEALKIMMINTGSGGISNNMVGVMGQAIQNGTGTVYYARGLVGQIWNLAANGVITMADALTANSPFISSTGTIGTIHGIFIGAQKITGVTTGYGVYQDGANDLNYFAGNVTINAALTVARTISTGGYTVATLPAGSIGMQAYVTDALAPTFLATVVGGGTVVTPVFYNGTNWIGS